MSRQKIPPSHKIKRVWSTAILKSEEVISNWIITHYHRQFWCKGYYVDTVGRNKKAIEEYIRNQLQEDIASYQLSLKEYIDPFTGEPVNKNKKK